MSVTARSTSIEGVRLIQPAAFGDPRGYFAELWRLDAYRELGLPVEFVQDNAAFSSRGVLRGLHSQAPRPQGKLVSVLHGAIYDVIVDIRPGSPTFGVWEAHELSSENHRQLWVPPGLAHGYQVLSEEALCAYKCTEYYDPHGQISLLWNDPALGITWPLENPILSAKDLAGRPLSTFPAQ